VCVFVGVFLSGFLSFQKKPVYYLGALPFFLLNILIRSSPACSRKKCALKDKIPGFHFFSAMNLIFVTFV